MYVYTYFVRVCIYRNKIVPCYRLLWRESLFPFLGHLRSIFHHILILSPPRQVECMRIGTQIKNCFKNKEKEADFVLPTHWGSTVYFLPGQK